MEQDITVLKHQINFNLRAEFIFYELQKSLENQAEVFVKHRGLAKRSNSGRL